MWGYPTCIGGVSLLNQVGRGVLSMWGVPTSIGGEGGLIQVGGTHIMWWGGGTCTGGGTPLRYVGRGDINKWVGVLRRWGIRQKLSDSDLMSIFKTSGWNLVGVGLDTRFVRFFTLKIL